MEYGEIARAESARGEVVLRERRAGDDSPPVIELRVNGVFVMDSLETGSELGLARAALEQCADPRSVLVGGLGLGFTARAVLDDSRVRSLAVVEVEDAIVRWMRDGTISHGPQCLADDRLTVKVADIRSVIAGSPPSCYDLVLLDVDNGPGYLVYEENATLYQEAFLACVREKLRPGGALAIWSAAEAPALEGKMAHAFGNALAIPFDVTLQSRDECYWLYVSRV
jgi:spermidine synthase